MQINDGTLKKGEKAKVKVSGYGARMSRLTNFISVSRFYSKKIPFSSKNAIYQLSKYSIIHTYIHTLFEQLPV